MKIESELPQIKDERTLAIQNFPALDQSILGNEGTGHYEGSNIRWRVCPWCQDTIPAEEDPCHYCGHLEPAAPTDKPETSHRSNHTTRIGFLVFVLALGLAMIIWPTADIPVSSSCGPDTEVSCFVSTSWGVPGGIYLIGLSMLCLGMRALDTLLHRNLR